MTRPSDLVSALYEIAAEEKPSKYRNKREEVDGIVFHSRREARRYRELKLLERVGEIHSLRLQPRYPLKVSGLLICTYVADFEYSTKRGLRIVEDVKGHRTREYIIKSKLFEAIHGFKVTEVS